MVLSLIVPRRSIALMAIPGSRWLMELPLMSSSVADVDSIE